jgi:hypothetical protein
MLRALQIENFRGLRKVDLPELRRVNLIVGANDTGKTSVLEALTLLLGDERMVASLASSDMTTTGSPCGRRQGSLRNPGLLGMKLGQAPQLRMRNGSMRSPCPWVGRSASKS